MSPITLGSFKETLNIPRPTLGQKPYVPDESNLSGIPQLLYVYPMKGTKVLYAASLSDEHLHSIGFEYGIKPDREVLISQIKQLTQIAKQNPSNEVILFINGDFLDYLESYIWEYKDMPNHFTRDDSGRSVELTKKILAANDGVIESLKDFLRASDRTRIVATIGNHDRRLQYDKNLPSLVQEALLPSASWTERDERIMFTSLRAICPELELYVEHGDRLDSCDYTNGLDDPSKSTWGDNLSYVTINLLKRQAEEIDQLREEGALSLSEATEVVKDILGAESIRNIPLFEAYLDNVCNKHCSSLKEQGRDRVARKVKSAFKSGIKEFANRLKEAPFLNYFVGGFFAKCLYPLAQLRVIREGFCLAADYIYKEKTHNNKYQISGTNEILEMYPKTKITTMGHIHIPFMYESGDKKIHVTTGAFIPQMQGVKSGPWYKPQADFEKPVCPPAGLLLWRDLESVDKIVKGETFDKSGEVKLIEYSLDS